VIEGTRVPVEIVIGRLGGGMSVEEVMDDYVLARKDVLAALNYYPVSPDVTNSDLVDACPRHSELRHRNGGTPQLYWRREVTGGRT
jgi:uncharacterized protein (DUF433 family)